MCAHTLRKAAAPCAADHSSAHDCVSANARKQHSKGVNRERTPHFMHGASVMRCCIYMWYVRVHPQYIWDRSKVHLFQLPRRVGKYLLTGGRDEDEFEWFLWHTECVLVLNTYFACYKCARICTWVMQIGAPSPHTKHSSAAAECAPTEPTKGIGQ